MSFFNILKQVLSSIGANKLRSFLTMFGIAWGVASLLLLIGLGEGFRSGQRKQLAELGQNVILAFGGTIPSLPGQKAEMRPYQPEIADLADVQNPQLAPHVLHAVGTLTRQDIKEVSEFSSAGGTVYGTQPEFPLIRHVALAQGRFLDSEDILNRRHVTVLGQRSATLLFPGHPALGAFITLNGTRFQVIGIAEKNGHGNNTNDNEKVYVPLSTMLELFPFTTGNRAAVSLSSIQYQPDSAADDDAARAEVHKIIGHNHGFDPSLTEAFNDEDTIKNSRTIDVIFDAMDLFLGGVGLVTLGLGAVGIVNIMLVTVSERTREIGLRKALGATKRSIMTQFFLEGLALTGISGLIGVLGAACFMGLVGSLVGDSAPQGFDPPRLVPWSAASALFTLSMCGVLAGLYPAMQAAALEPVEALRKD